MSRRVKGAIVRCLDEHGREVAKAITNELGRVILKNIPTGTYTLEVLTPEGFELECPIERLQADKDVFVFVFTSPGVKGVSERLSESVRGE